MICSDRNRDLDNSICLIADGSAPFVEGLDALYDLDYVDYSKGKQLEIELTAWDRISGLKEFYAEVHNLDNGAVVQYKDEDQDGKIQFTISEEQSVFLGEFSIIVSAKDRVGNEVSESCGHLGLGLEAYAERILEPHDGVYKRGESGILHTKALGYVEKVEVNFPKEFQGEDSFYDRTYVYEDPLYLQTEDLLFQIPFTVADGTVTIQVKAYKNGEELEESPRLVTIEIKGSILDELHTRLR